MKNKVYEIIQEKFIVMIEEAIKGNKILPWEKPWAGRPKLNYITRRPYRGVNLFLLPDNECEFITFKQLTELREKDPNIKLKKGCRKQLVVFWNMIEKENEETKEKEVFPLLRYYNVFSISDVEGLESKFIKFNHKESCENADKLIEDYISNNKITFKEIEGSDEAFYSPKRDYIQVPSRCQFQDLSQFYGTVFHEVAHSTGHPSRLNRFGKEINAFGDENYSKEELVAELTTSMILGSLGIENSKTEENSIAYLHGWLTAIKEDINLIVSASSRAQKASDFILNQCEEMELEEVV